MCKIRAPCVVSTHTEKWDLPGALEAPPLTAPFPGGPCMTPDPMD